jgi:multidrug efflux pump subunit AcrB
MEQQEQNKKSKVRNFALTVWAIENKNTIFLGMILLFLFGFYSYLSLPKELFPEINYPTVFVTTIYPGNSAEDIENLVTKQLEKELKTLKDVKRVRSTSSQDASMIFVEYRADVKIKDVIQDVKDAVDKAKPYLPSDLPSDPRVIELDFADFPVLTINISGKYNIDELKEFADYMKDQFELVTEVSAANIQGLSQKEIQVNVDMHKMQELKLSFNTIANAIKFENVTMSAGELQMGEMERSIRIIGEYESVEQIANLIIKSEETKPIFLKDIAEVKETYAKTESISRLWENPVISLQIIKKNNENVINCVDGVIAKVEEAKKNGYIPNDLIITYTNDQSKNIKGMLSNLENNIIMGVILVVLILLLFIGLRNAILVGLSIPISMFLSFAVLSAMGETVNMITLFSMILALGMLVDNSIVVVENIYRYVDKGEKLSNALKKATSEVAVPIITSTLTTLAAFFPLIFWNELMGQFMKLLPITLIIVLTASLVNALIFTPVLGRVFIKSASKIHKPSNKSTLIFSGITIGISIPLFIFKIYFSANILLISGLLFLSYTYLFFDLSKWTQEKFLVWLENVYFKFISFSLIKRNSQYFLGGVVLLLFVTLIYYFGFIKPKVVLFPNNQPKYFNVNIKLPIGTTIDYTDSVLSKIELDLNKLMLPYNDIIESKIVNVGNGVSTSGIGVGKKINLAQITYYFVDFEKRKGINTSDLQLLVSNYIKNRYPGVDVVIEKNRMGPPTGKAINIELKGDEMNLLIAYSDTIIARLDKAKIPGIEKLSLDIETGKPDLIIEVDKEKAGRYGVSTMQIASTIRNALFGSEVSKFKTEEEEYPIMVRFSENYRNNISNLLNQTITFRNTKGQEVTIPISSVASFKLSSSYSSIKRIDSKRTLTIESNVLEGYNANDVNKLIKAELSTLEMPANYNISYTGEQEDMKKSMEFLSVAMLIAVSLITIILVTQFNSIVKPLIIMASVLLSTIGVFGGLATFQMDFVIIMTGVGIISLAGVVVNNAIVLIDYIDVLKTERKEELGLENEDDLPLSVITECIINAGKVRLRPVLLTAITTVLGLVTLAIGFNIDFAGWFSKLEPNIYMGGDNVGFWGPMSWTVIFGLSFATLMTLVVVPVMYLIGNKIKLYFVNKSKLKE